MNNAKNKVTRSLFFLLSASLILMVCSQNSFLYSFNTEPDVSCFYLVGKCIAHGKVLYRDIYEQKGLYLYLMYMLAYFISDASYIGVYVLETVSLFVFMLFSFKIAYLLLPSERIAEIIAVLSGVFVCINDIFQEGGFAEEFLIPLLAIILFLALKYYYTIYPQKIPTGYTLTIGILSAVIFWVKYSALGLVVGLGIYVLVDLIKRKKGKELVICFLQLCLGFFIGSIPALVYFMKNHAMGDLVQSYFINLLVDYQDEVAGCSGMFNLTRFFLLGLDLDDLLANSMLFVFLLICVTIWTPKKRKKSGDLCIKYTFWGSLLLLAYGIIYFNCYQPLVHFIFIPITLVYLVDLVSIINYGLIKERCKKICDFVKKEYAKCIFGGLVLFILLAGFSIVKFPAIYVVAVVITLLLRKILALLERKMVVKFEKGVVVLFRYIFIAILIVFGYYSFEIWAHVYSVGYGANIVDNSLYYAGLGLLFSYIFEDIAEDGFEEMITYIKKRAGISKTNWENKTRFVTILLSLLLSIGFGNSLPYSAWSIEDTPQYKIADYIKKSGKENPVILAFDKCDNGIYNLLKEDPVIKFSGFYNNNFPEFKEERRNYFDNEIIDYIVITSHTPVPNSILTQFDIVLVEEEYAENGAPDYFVLLERK